jgi:hypothetical protein
MGPGPPSPMHYCICKWQAVAKKGIKIGYYLRIQRTLLLQTPLKKIFKPPNKHIFQYKSIQDTVHNPSSLYHSKDFRQI